jgi:anti-sigma B factor antagonist
MIRDVAVLRIRGSLIGDEGTSEVHEKVKELVKNGITKFVLDLAKVKWMNSHGMGSLMASYSTIQQVNGRFCLTHITDKVRQVLTITKLLDLFESFPTVKQALAAFK